MKAILGRKMGMTQVFAENGQMYPVTVVEVLPNVVTQVKTVEKDGYAAIQVGYEDKKESRANKAEKGIAKKANTNPHYFSKELKGDEMGGYNLGDKVTCDLFKAGDIVDVIGTSKGRGYLGTIQRWNHTIGPKGHGSGYHRGQGSFANQGRYNHGVMPGKHMSGHTGNESVSLLNVQIVDVNVEKGYILIKGGIPGAKRSIVTIRTAIKGVKNPDKINKLIDRTPVVEEKPVAAEPVAAEPIVEEPIVNEETAAPAPEAEAKAE